MTMNKMHAAEGSEPAACSGQRASDITLIGGSGGQGRAARIETARPAAARSGGAIPQLGMVPGPAASHPLAGEGTSAAGMDVSSLNLDPAASDGRRVLSRAEYVQIAAPLLAKGATWRQVGDACGLSWRAAKGRGEHAGLVSKRGPGRPLGALHTPETRARITESLRRRYWEGRR